MYDKSRGFNMNYYECCDNSTDSDGAIYAVIRAKSLTKARRMFITQTDARETIHYDPESINKFTYRQINYDISQMFDRVIDDLGKTGEFVLDYHNPKLKAIFGIIGWSDEDSIRCNCCDEYDTGREGSFEEVDIEDDSGSYCPECRKEKMDEPSDN